MMYLRTTTVKVDALRTLMQRFLEAVGCDGETAKTLAEVHLEADLRGVGIQGLNHLISSHLPHLKDGSIDPKGKPRVAKDGDTYALIDGGNGPGPIAGIMAADLVAEKGKSAGCAMVGITNGNDMFMAGYYVDRIARAGLVGMLFSDDEVPVIHPLGGREALIGSNPMAFAVPADGDPFLLDFAPTATLPTYVRYSRRYKVALPRGVAQDADGRPTIDPNAVAPGGGYQAEAGAISPLGNKGYGLLLLIDFLSGAFVGCDMGADHLTKTGARKGHFFLALDPEVFVGREAFQKAVGGRMEHLRASEPVPNSAGVRVPGDRAFAARRKALETGEVEVDRICWEDTLKLAEEMGVLARGRDVDA